MSYAYPTFDPTIVNLQGRPKEEQLNILNLLIDNHHSTTRREIVKAPLVIDHPQDWASKRTKKQIEHERIEVAKLSRSAAVTEEPLNALRSFLQLDTSTAPPAVASVIANLARLEAYNRYAAHEKARLIRLIETDQPLTAAASEPRTKDPRVRRMSTGMVQPAPGITRRTTEPRAAGTAERAKFAPGAQQTGANMVPVSGNRVFGRAAADGNEDVRMTGFDDDAAGRRQSTGTVVDPRRDPRRR